MSAQFELTLSERAWNEISRQAEESFPEECCGVIINRDGRDEVKRLKNIQNRLHALDPERYPRDATIAYNVDPLEFQSIHDEATATGGRIKAIYHSHPNHEAYFSNEDKLYAMPPPEEKPTYPDMAQIVISIYDRVVKQICAYTWLEEKKDFLAIPLRKLSS